MGIVRMYRPENLPQRRWDDFFYPIPIQYAIKPGHSKYCHWDVGSRGREAIVAPLRSRLSVTMMYEGTRKPKGGCASAIKATGQIEVWTVNQASGSQSKGLRVTRQSLIGRSVTEINK